MCNQRNRSQSRLRLSAYENWERGQTFPRFCLHRMWMNPTVGCDCDHMLRGVWTLTLFLPSSWMTLIARVGPLWPRIDFSHSEVFRRGSYAQKWLASNFFIFSCPKTPKKVLYFFIFCHATCKSTMAKNENFQAKIGQSLKILDTFLKF